MILSRPSLLLAAAFSWGLAACQSLPVQTIPDTADPTAEIDKLNHDRDAAFDAGVASLSPQHFDAAGVELKAARAERDHGGDARDILDHVAIGQAHLKKANETAAIAHTTLPRAIAARSLAVKARAPDLMKKDFDAVEHDFRAVTANLEDGDLKSSEGAQASLEQRFATVELAAIKKGAVGGAADKIEAAKKEDADKWAPRTLAETTKKLNDTVAFIDANRHDDAGIASRAQETTAAADHLLAVERQAKVTDKQDAEALVLKSESANAQIAAAQATVAAKATELQNTQSTAAKLADENSDLARQQAFEGKFTAAKARFTANEAEVLRDGNQLIVRLKGLGFASGKADLPTASYALMNKVAMVAKDFDAQTIDIQGNTDAAGSKTTNAKLSNDRAKAVFDYLAANGLEGKKMTFEGQGDTQPISSNKTAEGRAENRRVDIIVTPSQAAMGH